MIAEQLGAAAPERWRDRVRSASLSVRMLAASVVLAVLVAAAFGVLVYAVSTLHAATKRERHAKTVTAATLELEKLVLDLETGLRGFVLTGNASALSPWKRARAALPRELRAFQDLASATPDQARRARELATLINEYLRDYSIPVVELVQEVPAAARTSVVRFEGSRRVETIRRKFSAFLAAENALAVRSTSAADRRSEEAIALAVAGLIASAVLIGGFGFYLARAIAAPIREAADGAARLAAGELSTRLRPHGPGEVHELTQAFNRMAERLEHSRRELEAQNERLRESERAKSELVSVVAHELRTPLASVLGFTSVLLERDVSPEEERQYLSIVDAQARRLASLVNDFLDAERLETGKLVLAHELVDLARVVREQAQLFAGQSPSHLLEVSLPQAPLPVRGDPNRLAQVVANLLSNAIKYSPDGGVVRVQGEREGARVRVTVSDNGIGIPDEVQEEIFGRFVRGHATANGIEGSGLGLAIARSLVEAHNGHIDFTSKSGEGSTFWFDLPVAAID